MRPSEQRDNILQRLTTSSGFTLLRWLLRRSDETKASFRSKGSWISYRHVEDALAWEVDVSATAHRTFHERVYPTFGLSLLVYESL